MSPRLPPLAAEVIEPVIAPASQGGIPLAINTTSNAIGATVLIMSPTSCKKSPMNPWLLAPGV